VPDCGLNATLSVAVPATTLPQTVTIDIEPATGIANEECTALSRNKAAMLKRGSEATSDERITPEEAVKDSCVLEFLDLKDKYSETDLEEALIQRLTRLPDSSSGMTSHSWVASAACASTMLGSG
jgi:hypothetical protein